ncbi:M48 family metalloprotease [Nocardia wallacei]|uniref:M48 family metalloprotease n=1 Tax=Nocardia wallacei TaxID=480035 RepID=UPI002458A084|nr:M48 family metalloprotease [Nocardia wallacei]
MTSEVIAKANPADVTAVTRRALVDRAGAWSALLLAAGPSAVLMTVLLYGLGMALGLGTPAAVPVGWFLLCAAWGAGCFLGAERGWALPLFGLRSPTDAERLALTKAWHRVAHESGASASSYSLWVRTGRRGGVLPDRMIAVDGDSLAGLGRRELEAVLTHELGHRRQGRAALWQFVFRGFNAPVVLGERALLAGPVAAGDWLAQRVPPGGSRAFLLIWTALSRILVACPIVAMSTLIVGLEAALLLRLAPELAALALVPIARRAEHRADATAVDLGYGPDLCAVLRYRGVPADEEASPSRLSVSAVVLGTSPDDRVARIRDRLDDQARRTRGAWPPGR